MEDETMEFPGQPLKMKTLIVEDMDIRLPGENGLQLTKRIKTGYPDTKVVILTSYDSLEYREAAIRCGANCFISKDSMNWQQIETLIKSFDKVE